METTRALSVSADSRLWSRDFTLGMATAAFQIEGDAQRRQANIWDQFCDQPGAIADGSNGLVACDHVNRLEEDLDMLAALEVDAYRFSISWGRLLRADGTLDTQGADFYHRLLAGLEARSIKPWVTLYHWDLPAHFQDKGGWLNRDTAYRFQEYASAAAGEFAGKVAAWLTLNEPMCSAYLGYVCGIHAPGLKEPEHHAKVAHHLLLAHGLGMEALAQGDPQTPRGIALNISAVQPASSSAADQSAAQLAWASLYGRYLDPLFTGKYPALLKELPDESVPEIQPGDMELISQPIDILGINYYTRNCYQADEGDGFTEIPPQGELTDMGWEVYPEGLTQVLVRLDETYDLPPVFITENGAAFPDVLEDGQVDDEPRTRYVETHFAAIDAAIAKGVDVRGMFYWSLMDNFEWAEGYRKRFGVVFVNFSTMQRTLKASARSLQDFLRRRRSRWTQNRSKGGST